MLQAVISSKKFAKFFAFLTACLFFTLSCDQKPKQQPQIPPRESQHPNKLTRAIYSAYLQLDPHFVKAIADAAPLRDLLQGLMEFNPKGEVVPAIARELFSEDGKNWLIVLDEKATWSNGEPVTADDFVKSWQRLADPQNASPLASYLTYMGMNNAKEIGLGKLDPSELGVVSLNPHTLKIELRAVNFQLPKMLAHLALLPTYQGQKPDDTQPFISNGHYKIQEHSKLSLNLKARSMDLPFQEVYYQLIGTIQNPDRFDIIENPLENYKRNEVTLPKLCTYFYEFNFNDPYLSKKEIRQAIRSMISPTEISRDLGIPTHWVLPKTMSTDFTRKLSSISAEQIFHQLGIDANNPIKLTLTYDNGEQHKYIANRIARTLGQSDLFRIKQQEVDWKQLLAKREDKSFQFVRSGWCADYDDPLLFLMPFHSASLDNKSGYTNELVDKHLEKLAQTNLDKAQREKLIADIVRQLEHDVAILPLFQYQRRISINPEIRGVELDNSSEVIYSKDLYRQ